MSSDPVERHYSTEHVAELFEVTPETVRRWITEGKLKAVQINRFWRVPESELKRFAESLYG